MLDGIVRWFIESAWAAGIAPSAMPGFADNPYPWLECFEQQNPGWQWVDPQKDANASILRIDKALTSRTREMMQQGVDFANELETMIDEEQKLARLYELRRQNASLADATLVPGDDE